MTNLEGRVSPHARVRRTACLGHRVIVAWPSGSARASLRLRHPRNVFNTGVPPRRAGRLSGINTPRSTPARRVLAVPDGRPHRHAALFPMPRDADRKALSTRQNKLRPRRRTRTTPLDHRPRPRPVPVGHDDAPGAGVERDVGRRRRRAPPADGVAPEDRRRQPPLGEDAARLGRRHGEGRRRHPAGYGLHGRPLARRTVGQPPHNDALDPTSRMPEFKVCAARVDPIAKDSARPPGSKDLSKDTRS